jgi:putative hemolysin
MQQLIELPESGIGRLSAPRKAAGNPLILREGALELRLAGNRADMADAQRLRFAVFHQELRLGLASSMSSGLDQDAHDGHCDHLLVVDTARDCLVGTYRLLSFEHVPSFGFYSESEFDLANVKRCGLRLLELGRSCVAPEYRDGKVIRLLFLGIAEYLRRCGADALMGCASIHGVDAAELSAIQEMLCRRFLTGPELRVTPRRGFPHAAPAVQRVSPDGRAGLRPPGVRPPVRDDRLLRARQDPRHLPAVQPALPRIGRMLRVLRLSAILTVSLVLASILSATAWAVPAGLRGRCRSEFLRAWSLAMCFLMGIKVEVLGESPPQGPWLAVSNHLGRDGDRLPRPRPENHRFHGPRTGGLPGRDLRTPTAPAPGRIHLGPPRRVIAAMDR